MWQNREFFGNILPLCKIQHNHDNCEKVPVKINKVETFEDRVQNNFPKIAANHANKKLIFGKYSDIICLWKSNEQNVWGAPFAANVLCEHLMTNPAFPAGFYSVSVLRLLIRMDVRRQWRHAAPLGGSQTKGNIEFLIKIDIICGLCEWHDNSDSSHPSTPVVPAGFIKK